MNKLANRLDQFLGYFSPALKVRRMRYRYAAQLLEEPLRSSASISSWRRKYEGASTSRRTEGWLTPDSSANTEITSALSRLRARSRDLVRNNGYAARAIQVIHNNVVGAGILGQVKATSSARERDYDRLWKEWSETPQVDFEGMQTLSGLERLVMRTIAESGECFIRKRPSRSSENLIIPLQVQILEGDFVDSTLYREGNNGHKIIQGIEFDSKGRRIAYHLFEEHPGDRGWGRSITLKANRIPARDILHLYRIDRAGQIRGVPWMAPCMIRLRDFDEYEDAQLVRQKIAACFTAFVQDLESQPEPLTDSDNEKLGEKVEPAMIEFLPPGKTVTFANPPGVEGYKEYTSVTLHAIAAGLGIPYECLTGDYSEVNFSSARMGWLEFMRNIEEWRWLLLIPRFLDPVFDWFLQASELQGRNSHGVEVVWTPPKREMIDPTKEIPALIQAIRAGILTLSEVIKMYGYDPLDHLEQMRKDNETLDKLGLVLDSDPRKVSSNGNLQSTSLKSPEQEGKHESEGDD